LLLSSFVSVLVVTLSPVMLLVSLLVSTCESRAPQRFTDAN
jgi:hypothetical protein